MKKSRPQKEELIKLLDDPRHTTGTIGNIYGVSHKTVWRWFKFYELKTRPYGYMPLGYKRPPLSDEAKEKLRKAHLGKKLSPKLREIALRNLVHLKGKDHPWYKGGRYVNKYGYVMILNKEHPRNRSGYVPEHRLVLEDHLGRYLNPSEHVHHINGHKQDNRIKNLIIVSNQDHAKIEWSNPQKIKKQSERLKKIRSEKYWSTKKRV